jgi:hypothetical protein
MDCELVASDTGMKQSLLHIEFEISFPNRQAVFSENGLTLVYELQPFFIILKFLTYKLPGSLG